MRRLLAALALTLGCTTPAAAGHPMAAPVVTIDAASLQRLAATGRPIAVIDLRPVQAYADGRLPGAQSIPLEFLVPRRGEVPGDVLVVLYGTASVDEVAAAYRYLRMSGHTQVFVLEDGFAGWQSRGYGVER